jgi:mgtE-like transporter
MRGNVFGALGSRLGTAIHAGTFRMSRRLDTLVGQNAAAAFVLSIATSVVLAVLAKSLSSAFGIAHTISLVDFFVVSIVGAILASVVVLVITVAVAAFCARRDFDLDNVASPIVTAAGDVVTLPSLFLATYLLGIPFLTPTIALVAVALAFVAFVAALRSGLPILRRVVIESIPVLIMAGTVDVLAGLTIENRFQSFLAFPALLVLVPPFLEDSGALGSILTARLSTKLHLGTLQPARAPWRAAAEDFLLVYVYAVPVFLLLGLSADLASAVAGLHSPGSVQMVLVSLLGGLFATTSAVFVGYYAAVATHRLGLDPDNHGVPSVTSSLDLLGALSLILAIVMLGIA